MAWINGKKTYIVMIAGIAWAWLQVWNGTLDQGSAIDMTLGALGLGAVRHGISTTGVKS